MAQAPVPSLATSRLASRAPLGCRVSRRAPVARSGTRPDPIVARDDDARRDPRTSEAPTLDRRGLLVGAAASCASAPLAARADTEDIAKAYDGYAATYDDLDGGAFAAETLGLEKSRRDLTSRATGDVLELGVGTGLNLPGYDLRAGGAIRSLTAVDISGGMLNEARTRADELGFRVQTNAEFEAGGWPTPRQPPRRWRWRRCRRARGWRPRPRRSKPPSPPRWRRSDAPRRRRRSLLPSGSSWPTSRTCRSRTRPSTAWWTRSPCACSSTRRRRSPSCVACSNPAASRCSWSTAEAKSVLWGRIRTPSPRPSRRWPRDARGTRTWWVWWRARG